MSTPLFDEFLESGLEESISPFLTPPSRGWARFLPLKASLIAAVLLALAFILSFFPPFLSLSHVCLLLVYFVAGIPSLIESVEDLLNLEINIDVLMTLAAFLSVIIGSSMEGALLLVLFSLSGSIEAAVTSKAKGAVRGLKHLAPPKACVISPTGTLYERSVKDIEVGTLILVKVGEIVPLDAKIMEGVSSVNLVHLTGENLPLAVKVGEEVAAGARNLEGSLTMRVTQIHSDSTLERLIQLITQAHEARPKLQRWIDKATRYYAMSIIGLAFLAAITLPYFLSIPYFGVEGGVYRALAFLVAASPCAIVIALPIAYLCAVGAAARKGIILKGGLTLDALAQCHVLAFDKTGTLTTGVLSCTNIEPLHGEMEEAEALSIALALERNAVHPIAHAIVQYAQARGIQPATLTEFHSVAGQGLEGTFRKNNLPTKVFMGKPSYILPQLSAEDKEKLQGRLMEIQEKGDLLAVLAVGSTVILFQFRDTPRPAIRSVLENLKKQFRLVMLTGDHTSSAKSIADEIGIDEFHAELKPEDKLSYVTELSQKEGLAMIGDGINDAPALARATVGISMGEVGSATAIDASDVVLLHDNLNLLSWLMDRAKKTQVIVRQNMVLASAVILFATIPALSGLVPLWLAVLLHEGGTLIVGLNGLRLLKK